MFQIKAAYDEQLEVKTSIERVREFFTDLGNFVKMMPGVEKITSEAGGVVRWLIRADIPVIGSVKHVFAVEQTENGPERIEWSPAAAERKNFLRYSIAFQERGAATLIRIAERVELRRQNARELHVLASFVGATRLSAEMQKGVTQMMQTFLQRARTELEKQ
ncbi:MAG TPA: SRPBCC family protein [Pyrinomonadaceae bacterium]|nr:SRPBCC family protein [Pyrinomonadaceae bacterium]